MTSSLLCNNNDIIIHSKAQLLVSAVYSKTITASLLTGSVGDALVEHFFGSERDQLLTVGAFQKFHSELRMNILQLEVCVCGVCMWGV